MKAVYRILDANHNVMYTGSVIGSWFTLEEAQRIVEAGQMIYQYSDDYMHKLWEVL